MKLQKKTEVILSKAGFGHYKIRELSDAFGELVSLKASMRGALAEIEVAPKYYLKHGESEYFEAKKYLETGYSVLGNAIEALRSIAEDLEDGD